MLKLYGLANAPVSIPSAQTILKRPNRHPHHRLRLPLLRPLRHRHQRHLPPQQPPHQNLQLHLLGLLGTQRPLPHSRTSRKRSHASQKTKSQLPQLPPQPRQRRGPPRPRPPRPPPLHGTRRRQDGHRRSNSDPNTEKALSPTLASSSPNRSPTPTNSPSASCSSNASRW